jgi:hypothetical protein
MTQKLSPEAMDILINTAPRQGATPKGKNLTSALRELVDARLLGPDYGLTSKGVTAREHEYSRRLDLAFL